MSRLWIFSDLHQDCAGNAWDPARHAPASGFNVVIAAGDLHSPLTAAIDWLADRFAGCRVIYSPGNHDFWWDGGDDRYTLADQMARGRDLAARRGIDLLMDDAVVIDGARFVGATLWTDMRLGTFSSGHAFNTARRFMNDYRRIRRRRTSRHRYVRPVDTVALHRASRAFIDAALAQPHAGPTVVVTHHAPHPASLPDPHADLNWCYASDLSDLIAARAPDLWIHGHVHVRRDYRVGATRIVCNPRGHAGEDSARDFDPPFVINVTPAIAADRAPPAVDLVDRIRDGDAAALAEFSRLAFADPRAAAGQLAAWFDRGVTHQDGSSDGIALEDWAFSFDPEDLDWVAYRARDKNLPPPLRLAMAAIVAGGRAMYDDIRNAA